ncbi:MAG: alginate export family protein [Planctomycetes bacterium]|nr:alginate export family protein [Planctomycetota bacterium]
MRTTYALCVAAPLVALIAAPSPAQSMPDTAPATAPAAETAAPSFDRPKYKFLRWMEDWSVMDDIPPGAPTDFWDPIKFVPLNEDGSNWASFGGHARLRFEDWQNFGFGMPTGRNDDAHVLWRMTLHGDFHFGENLRAFFEGKSAIANNRDLAGGRRGLDVDSLDLEQAFVDIGFDLGGDARLTVRPGRQQLLLGKQRLVSPLAWSNTMRRWDGVSAILNAWDWKIHGFWTQFAPVQKYSFNDPDAQTQFFGVYATGKFRDSSVGTDLYFLGLDRDDPRTFNGTTGPEERYTIGGRLFGKCGDSGFDYDFEGAYQFGEVGPGDVNAFMIGSQFGYKPTDWWGAPRFFIGYDYASGDDAPGGDVETFNHLFPLGHAYLGYIDVVGRQNAIDFNLGATLKPMEKMTVGITGHFFWRAEDTDALYNAGGGVVRAPGIGTDSEIGQEIDLTVKYAFDRHLTALFGYSYFFAGDFISQTGPADDINFFYTQLQYTF